MTEQDHKEVEDIASQLIEKFDSVIILVTRNDEGKSGAYVCRRGNYYASKGLMFDWIERERHLDYLFEKKKSED